jgi:hypothetical protein
LFKARQRYESFKTLRQIPGARGSEIGYAIILSFLDHLLELKSYVRPEEWEKWAHDVTIHKHFSYVTATLDPNDFVDAINASHRTPSRLTKEIGVLPTFIACLNLAIEVAGRISIPKKLDARSQIIREIVFPPETQQAGISILNYFAVIIQEKYPDIDVAISIKQEADRVTLKILHPDGKEEEITKTLCDYGLVVTGKMRADDFLEDKLKALALQHKLELAEMEIRQTRELLQYEKENSSSRIKSLEEDIKNLYSLLGQELSLKETLHERLLNLLELQISAGSENRLAERIVELSKSIIQHDEQKTALILDDISTQDPDVFTKLCCWFYEGAFTGVIGNATYDWLKAIFQTFK